MYVIEVDWIGGEIRFLLDAQKLATGTRFHWTPHRGDAKFFASYLKAEEAIYELELDGEGRVVRFDD